MCVPDGSPEYVIATLHRCVAEWRSTLPLSRPSMVTSAMPYAGPLAVIQPTAVPVKVSEARAAAAPLVRYEPPLALVLVTPAQVSYLTLQDVSWVVVEPRVNAST